MADEMAQEFGEFIDGKKELLLQEQTKRESIPRMILSG